MDCTKLHRLKHRLQPVSRAIRHKFLANLFASKAVLIHQGSVPCAWSAGLATCTAVFIGHSVRTVVCDEDGSIPVDSRVRFDYGAWQMHKVFRLLIHHPHLLPLMTARALDMVCSLHIEENNRLILPTVQGRRINLGPALRTIPAYGFYRRCGLAETSTTSAPQRERQLSRRFVRRPEAKRYGYRGNADRPVRKHTWYDVAR